MAKKPVVQVVLDEDAMRLMSLVGDPYAEAILNAVRVRKPKEDDSDSCRSI